MNNVPHLGICKFQFIQHTDFRQVTPLRKCFEPRLMMFRHTFGSIVLANGAVKIQMIAGIQRPFAAQASIATRRYSISVPWLKRSNALPSGSG